MENDEERKYKVFGTERLHFDLTTKEGNDAAKEFFRTWTLEGRLEECEAFAKRALEELRLPLDDPWRLIKSKTSDSVLKEYGLEIHPGNDGLHDPAWPEHIKFAANMLWRTSLVRENLASGESADAVWNTIAMMTDYSWVLLYRYEKDIALGRSVRSNSRKAAQVSKGARSATRVRKEEIVVNEAKELLKKGIEQKSLAGILAKKDLGYGAKSIRKLLKLKGLLE